MARGDVVLEERLRDFDRAQRSNHAVIVSAFGHAVDVRATQNRLLTVIAAGAPANKIAGGINRNLELRRAHQAQNVLAALSIGFAVSDAADTALRVLAKLSQGVDVVHEARAIRPQRCWRSKRKAARANRSGRAQQSEIELSPVHIRINALPLNRRHSKAPHTGSSSYSGHDLSATQSGERRAGSPHHRPPAQSHPSRLALLGRAYHDPSDPRSKRRRGLREPVAASAASPAMGARGSTPRPQPGRPPGWRMALKCSSKIVRPTLPRSTPNRRPCKRK